MTEYTVEIEDSREVGKFGRLSDWLCGCGYWWRVYGAGASQNGQARSSEAARRKADRYIAEQKAGLRAKKQTYKVDE